MSLSQAKAPSSCSLPFILHLTPESHTATGTHSISTDWNGKRKRQCPLRTNENYSSLSRNLHPLAGQSFTWFSCLSGPISQSPPGSVALHPISRAPVPLPTSQSSCDFYKVLMLWPHFLSQAPSKHLLPLPFYRTVILNHMLFYFLSLHLLFLLLGMHFPLPTVYLTNSYSYFKTQFRYHCSWDTFTALPPTLGNMSMIAFYHSIS